MKVIGSDANAASLNLGVTYALNQHTTLVTLLGIGLTPDAPDFTRLQDPVHVVATAPGTALRPGRAWIHLPAPQRSLPAAIFSPARQAWCLPSNHRSWTWVWYRR